MKFKTLILLGILMTSLVFPMSTASANYSVEENALETPILETEEELTPELPAISSRRDVQTWYYREGPGRGLFRRLWSNTRGIWLTEWTFIGIVQK